MIGSLRPALSTRPSLVGDVGSPLGVPTHLVIARRRLILRRRFFGRRPEHDRRRAALMGP